MQKTQIGAKPFLYPMPTTLVGANVNGKPTYLTIAYCSMVSSSPPIIAVSLNKVRYTSIGIKENGTFSVNIPSVEMVKITDYCGLVSGHKVDKSRLFDTFYGKLGTAPMIRECPISLECRLLHVLEFGSNELFVGEIVEAYAEERYLTDGLPDIKKIDPIVFSMNDRNYWRVGQHLGKAFSIGREFEPKNP